MRHNDHGTALSRPARESRDDVGSGLPRVYHIKSDKTAAIRLTAENILEVATWCDGVIIQEQDRDDREQTYGGLNVPTGGGGYERASEGDYVLKNSSGRFSAMKPGAFERKFEEES